MRLLSAQFAWVFLLVGSLGVSSPAQTPSLTTKLHREVVSRISGNIMCTCSCPHILKQCGDECGMAPQQISKIEQLVATGQTEEQVYAIYEKEFGVGIHAVPKAEGFNLLAWIVPFAGLLFGLSVVVLTVKRLQGEVPTQSTLVTAPEISEKYRKLLEKELRE